MTTYSITTDPREKHLLAPVSVGQKTSVPVRKINGSPWTIQMIQGRVVSITDSGYSAKIAYNLPAGYEPS